MGMDRETICVYGLSHFGIPLASLCSTKGYKVYGYEPCEKTIESLNQDPDIQDALYDVTLSDSSSSIAKSDVIIVCLSLKKDERDQIEFKPLKQAMKTIRDNLKPGALIIVESTINPGVTEEIIKPLLEERYNDGADFFLAHCPERINPGDKEWTVENLPRVLGSTSEQGLEEAYDFYKSILTAEIKKMSSIKATEAVKIVENSFRDVNIAFVNELAKSFDSLGIDINEVILGCSTKPFGFLPHFPSCGVGGHSIPVEPYYLVEKAQESDFSNSFLRLARKVNNSMPQYTVDLVSKSLNKFGLPIKGTKIGILGLSYKAGVKDTRSSPSYEVINILKEMGAELKIHDPHVPTDSNAEIEDVLSSDCVVLLTNHPEFKDLDFTNTKCVVDGHNFLEKETIENYTGIGR
jgi:UDP-N-acetyl-D-glucosamine dehydrogenase